MKDSKNKNKRHLKAANPVVVDQFEDDVDGASGIDGADDVSDVNESENSDEQVWLDEIVEIFEESGLIDIPIEVEENKIGDATVFYVVATKGSGKTATKERVATVYESPSETYDASAVADILAAIFELVPSLIEELIDVEKVDTVKIAESGNKLSAVRFMVDRAMESASDETVSIETLKSFIGSINAILNSDEVVHIPEQKKSEKVSLLHLLPDAARNIFGL